MSNSTLVEINRPVRRQVKSIEPRTQQPYVVIMDARVVRIRTKHSRREYVVTYDQIYHMGGMNFSAATRKVEGK